MNCLWCHQDIITEIDWTNVFSPPRRSVLCRKCRQALSPLEGQRCHRCSRASISSICSDCKWWTAYTQGCDPLTYNHSIFSYNGRMQEMIARWKYRGDYHLGYAFQQPFTQAFAKQFSFIKKKQAVVIPIPLSAERTIERGFNQADMLAHFLKAPKRNILTRLHTEKQSKKGRAERIFAKNPFKLLERVNKPVILIDDIYTTGTTLRHAAQLLVKHGCPEVYSYTLVRG